MKRLTILCAALTAAMFMNMSAYAGTSEVATEVSAGTVCLPGADLTDVMGCGSIFSDQHPEITDPEYYLKEWYNSPQEGEQSILNAHGEYKTPYNNYMDEAYPLLQEFLHSFDWIHADEYTRYQKAFERVGAAYHGNIYDADAGYISIGGERMADMNEKKLTAYRRKHLGYVFQMYNLIPNLNELAELCKLVGVRCEAYQSSAYHKRCLVQIGEIWYVVDPTNNGVKNCKAVDYAAERDRYKNEYFASEEAQILQEQLDMGEKAQKGEITWREYFHYLFPDYTDEQIQSQLGMSYEEYGNLWK